jgi:hypothetical protein
VSACFELQRVRRSELVIHHFFIGSFASGIDQDGNAPLPTPLYAPSTCTKFPGMKASFTIPRLKFDVQLLHRYGLQRVHAALPLFYRSRLLLCMRFAVCVNASTAPHNVHLRSKRISFSFHHRLSVPCELLCIFGSKIPLPKPRLRIGRRKRLKRLVLSRCDSLGVRFQKRLKLLRQSFCTLFVAFGIRLPGRNKWIQRDNAECRRGQRDRRPSHHPVPPLRPRPKFPTRSPIPSRSPRSSGAPHSPPPST